MLAGQLVMVDAINDGQVDALRGRRNQHALRARRQMFRRTVAVGKETRAFQRDIDAQFAVRQLGGIALRGDADRLAVHHHRVAFGPHLAWERTVDAVARSEEHTYEPQSLMRNSYAVFR